MTSQLHKSTLLTASGLALFAIGVGLGVVLPVQSPIETLGNQYEINSSYRFINPLLSCGDDSFSRVQNGEVLQLQNEITTYIQSQEVGGSLDAASVYFRELNGGQYLSINPDFEFVPASLLKVPLAMSMYLKAEQEPSFLMQKVRFASTSSPAHEYFTAPTIATGSTYSIEQLVDAMLENSDNSAALLLAREISTANLDASYSNLGLSAPTNDGYTMTASQYAEFFRVLYNATYLNHNDSEHMLDILSHSTFTQGLVTGLPQGVVVAHKFGERGYNNPKPDQLHDCGIIYAKAPYLLCVVTQGSGYDAMAGVIAHISKLVYEYAGP